MAALISSDFEIPAEISQGIFEKAQKGSTLAQLSGARPQKFGKQQVWVLTSPPKAELVGEAGQKSPTPTAYASKTVNPFKLQVTMRFYSGQTKMYRSAYCRIWRQMRQSHWEEHWILLEFTKSIRLQERYQAL